MKNCIKKLIGFTTVTLSGLYVANRLIEIHATSNHILDTKEGHFFKYRYGNIFYTKEGSGEPILLVHNLSPESSGFEWSKITHQLSKTHTVYTIDLLGCGRSDKPTVSYTNFMYVCALDNFIKEVIGKRTSIIASGRSSVQAIMATSITNSLIKDIILINPQSANKDDKLLNEPRNVMKFIFSLPIIGTYIYNVNMRRSYILSRCNKNYCTKKYYITPDMINAYYEACHLGKGNGRFLHSSILCHYLNANIKNVLANLPVPLLIIESRDENAYGSFEEYNDKVQYVKLNDAIGMPHVELPRKCCDIITDFIN